ncbi:MAG: hypothetical protein V7L14_17855 [Nostoc sp.]|uniref:hypothetical protein n=1 Tax=Nostoc sp. TaxID=1180 RepID=UPI002FF577FE
MAALCTGNRTGNRIWTLKRDNQHLQHSHSLKRNTRRVRQRVEGVFHEIQNTGRNPDSAAVGMKFVSESP